MIRHSHSSIRAALSTARRWGWVPTNVAELARPPKLPEQEVTAATTAQVRKLIDVLERTDPDLAHMVLIGALTGCRRGELCGLRWSDWDGDRLHVRRRVIEASGRVSVRDSTKSGKGKRIVMDPLGIATLKRLRALQAARAKEARAKLPPDGWMLSVDGLGGNPRRPKAVSMLWPRRPTRRRCPRSICTVSVTTPRPSSSPPGRTSARSPTGSATLIRR